MSLLADFSPNITTFPSFDTLPSATNPSSSSSSSLSPAPSHAWYLVGQIAENMTITQPTLICRDRTSASFALTFEERDFSLASFKKGFTVVVKCAKRTEAKEEGKRGFVTVAKGLEAGSVRCLPGSMDRVLNLAGAMAEGEKEVCGVCGGEGTRKCTGCGWARYCGKVRPISGEA